MAKALHFDCFNGAAGDMVLGGLLDLGLPLEALRGALGSLAIEYGGVSATRVLRAGVSATRFAAHAETPPSDARGADHGHDHHDHDDHGHNHHDHDHHDHVHHDHGHHNPQSQEHHHQSEGPAHAAGHHGHHSLKEIAGAIRRSALSPQGRDRAIHLFERLAEAEAAIHGMTVDQVHLHEVGALDSIIDIVGAVYGLEWLGAGVVTSSPLNVGSGTVECAHGTFPVPAPATARLLTGVPVYAGAIAKELVTPTGALIVTDYASAYGPLPPMRVDGIGYGAGSRDFKGHPNVLRLFVGETSGDRRRAGHDD